MNTSSSKIERWRKENGVKQSDFAEKIGITQSYLSKIEKGFTPNFDVAKMIAGEINCPVDELFTKYKI